MKKSILVVFLALFLVHHISAKEERIRFSLKFGLFKGGEAELTVTDTVYNGRPAIHYHMLGRTTGLAEKLYGVYDVYETTVDAETHLPLKTIRSVKEGDYRRYNETYFYHDNDSIYSQRSGGRKVPRDLVDIISVFFYFVHTQDIDNMASGDGVAYPTLNADKISDVSVRYLHEEVVETDIGMVDTYVLNPSVRKGKVLERSDGIRFYMSKHKKLPVYITFEMRVGALKAVIRSYTIDGVEQVTD
jgi:hypothetical protein